MAQLKRAKIASTEPGPRKQSFACVPHADGFIGLLDVPGLRACASLPVRADCRPDMHSCRPLPLPWSAPSASGTNRSWKHPGSAKLANLRAPFRAARPSQRAPYRLRDGPQCSSFVLSSTKRFEILLRFFLNSRNRNHRSCFPAAFASRGTDLLLAARLRSRLQGVQS